ncbi:MAG: hypothetical protein EU543_05130 [Promethearchaeota archaeon]|nr:MAG: hypothetical protein EU543_05130 [Candidatus Lokiarchaeota archaeon]
MRMEIPLSPQENEALRNLHSIILCAGEGTRFGEKTELIPKPLIKNEKLNNKPILLHTINHLIQSRIRNITIIEGYRGDQIEEYISSLKKEAEYKDLNLITIDSEGEYQKGPFYSFLSIRKNKILLNENHFYLIIPGDTIFESGFFQYITQFYCENTSILSKFPYLFYRTVKIKKIESKRYFPIVKSKPLNQSLLNEIQLQKRDELSNQKEIKQLYPILLLSFQLFQKVIESEKRFKGKSLRDWLNFYSYEGNKIHVHEIKKGYEFFDIDTPNDLKSYKKKKVDNRFH